MVAIGVEHAPGGADRVLQRGFPRLIEGFHDVVVIVEAVGENGDPADVVRLVHDIDHRRSTIPPDRGPAGFRDQQPLAREGLMGLTDNVDEMLLGLVYGDRLVVPERQDMNRNEIQLAPDLGIAQHEGPDVGGRNRLLDGFLDPPDIADQLVRGEIAAQQHLVADHNLGHRLRMLVRLLDALGEFLLVDVLVRAQPDAEGHLDVVLLGQFGQMLEPFAGRIGADVPGAPDQHLQILFDFLRRRIGLGQRTLAAPIGGEGHAVERLGIFRRDRDRPIGEPPDRSRGDTG